MGMQDIGGLQSLIELNWGTATGTPAYSTTLVIDAADEKAAFIVQAPKTGNIDRVGFLTRTVTTGATVDVRVETVDGTTGNPTGTLWATNTNKTQAIADTDDNLWFNVDLTAAAAVTIGQTMAIAIANPSVSFGNMVIASMAPPAGVMPYSALYTTSWAKQLLAPVLALRYDDGVYYSVPGCVPWNAVSTTAYHSGSTPDENGNIFRLPFGVRVVGWNGRFAAGTSADFDIVLYDSDGTTALLTYSKDATNLGGTSASNLWGMFSGTANLKPNTDYRITLKPTTANSVTLNHYTVHANGLFAATKGGANCYWTYQTNGGGFAQTNTQRAQLGILYDQIDDGFAGRQVQQVGRGFTPIY
jgi:hypothetical protein